MNEWTDRLMVLAKDAKPVPTKPKGTSEAPQEFLILGLTPDPPM